MNFNYLIHKLFIITTFLLVIASVSSAFADTTPTVQISAIEWTNFIERSDLGISKEKVNELIWNSINKNNNTLTRDDLLAIADMVTVYFRDKGFPFVSAYLPEQNLSDGTLKIAIIEGKLGDIQCPGETAGDRDYACDSIKNIFADLLDKPVYEPEFVRRIESLRTDLRIDVFGYFSRGSNPGEARVNFKIKKFRRWQFNISADNFGNPATGKNRLNLRASIFSPLHRLDTLMVGGVYSQGSDSNEEATYGYIAYETPLWNLSNRISVYIANNLFEVGGDFQTLELEGDSRVGAIEYHHDWGDRSLQQRVSLAAQTIETDYKSVFNSPSLEPDENEKSGKLSWQLSWLSKSGLSEITNRLGYVGGQYTSNQFAEDRDFEKLELALSTQILFASKSWYANHWRFAISGQYTEKALPNAERRSFSGINGLRAIEAGYFSGDNLAYSSLEWRFPKLFGELENTRIQPLIFIEGAYGEKLLNGQISDRTHATGVGIGLEFSVNDMFYGRVYAMDLLDSYSLSNTTPKKMSVLAELGFGF